MTADAETDWLDGMRRGDPGAARALWDRYFQRLADLAGRKLPAQAQRSFDGEDVALSAFRAFAAAAREGRYPDLADPHDLWRILFVITSRKATSYLRKEAAGKRGAGAVRGDSGFGVRTDDHAGIDGVVGAEPTPEFLSEALEQYHRLLDALEGPLRDIAVLRAEGFTVAEIADRLGTARRTVERRLTMIRVRLVEMVGDDGGGAADPVAL